MQYSQDLYGPLILLDEDKNDYSSFEPFSGPNDCSHPHAPLPAEGAAALVSRGSTPKTVHFNATAACGTAPLAVEPMPLSEFLSSGALRPLSRYKQPEPNRPIPSPLIQRRLLGPSSELAALAPYASFHGVPTGCTRLPETAAVDSSPPVHLHVPSMTNFCCLYSMAPTPCPSLILYCPQW